MKVRVPQPLWILAAAIVLVVVAAGLGIGVPAYRQQVAMATIERLGGQVNTRPNGPNWLRDLVDDERLKPFDDVTSFRLAGTTIHDADLHPVHVLTRVRRVQIFSAQIAEMKSLSRLASLEMLELDHTPLTATAIDDLNRSKSLRSLVLARTSVNEPGLARLDHITSLTLDRVEITDAGLREVGRMSHLRALTFLDVPITDGSLDFLKTLTNLAYLRLYDTNLTDAGVVELQRALPKLTIER